MEARTKFRQRETERLLSIWEKNVLRMIFGAVKKKPGPGIEGFVSEARVL